MPLLSALTSGALALALSPPAQEAAAPNVLLVRGRQVIVRPGEILEDAAVLVADGRIVAVGTDLQAPEGAREISGEVVCAGLVDPWSVFGLEESSATDTRTTPATRALDGVDPYLDPRLERDVLRGGVTAVRVQAGTNAREAGIGALVRVRPEADPEELVVLDDCCVAFSVGLTRNNRLMDPFDRISELDRVVGAIADGESYLQDKTEYRYELEEWQKAIAEKEQELEKGFKKAKQDREKDEAKAKEEGKEFKEKRYKEDRKPRAPKFDEDKEVMARVANGELPLVIEAHRAAELREVLKATERFRRLRLIVAGGTEAMAVAPELARRRIPVIVWPAPLGSRAPDEFSEADLALAGRLEEKGVEVLIGTGGTWPPSTRELRLYAALAVGQGLDREAALDAMTLGAARALDAADRIGSLERGKDADLLVLDGHPLDTTARVRYVVSAGDVVLEPEER